MHKLVFILILLAGVMSIPASSVLGQSEGGDESPVTIHVVQRGENLFRIALNYGLTTEEVAQVNGITDPTSILVGQRLIIPVGGVPAAQTPAEPIEHQVQAGETLASIATLYSLTVEDLARRNGITNPNTIFVGQVLTVGENTADPNTPVQSTATSTHIVQRGETLFTIATSYGTSVEVIQSLNEISNASVIFVGQELLIPADEAQPSAVNFPAPITAVDVLPLAFTEGETGRVRVVTSSAATIIGTFLNTALAVTTEENGTIHTMLIGVPVGTAPNIYTMLLTVTSVAGIVELPINIQVSGAGYGTQFITLPEDRLPLLTPAVEENELSILQGVTDRYTPERYFNGPFGLPAAAAMNSAFGATRSYNNGVAQSVHTGADFAAAPGAAVLAAAPGRVALADTLNIRGISVIIDHGWGIYTNYSHMAERYVELGQFVETGDVIGAVGSTGRSTGAHLHWELWVNGVPVDPLQWTRVSFP